MLQISRNGRPCRWRDRLVAWHLATPPDHLHLPSTTCPRQPLGSPSNSARILSMGRTTDPQRIRAQQHPDPLQYHKNYSSAIQDSHSACGLFSPKQTIPPARFSVDKSTLPRRTSGVKVRFWTMVRTELLLNRTDGPVQGSGNRWNWTDGPVPGSGIPRPCVNVFELDPRCRHPSRRLRRYFFFVPFKEACYGVLGYISFYMLSLTMPSPFWHSPLPLPSPSV